MAAAPAAAQLDVTLKSYLQLIGDANAGKFSTVPLHSSWTDERHSLHILFEYFF